jgi:hypothetical protein
LFDLELLKNGVFPGAVALPELPEENHCGKTKGKLFFFQSVLVAIITLLLL